MATRRTYNPRLNFKGYQRRRKLVAPISPAILPVVTPAPAIEEAPRYVNPALADIARRRGIPVGGK